MKLLVMRHGTAEEAKESDFARRLTARGVEGVNSSVERLLAQSERPTRIFASPLVRAQQTAKLVADNLHFLQPVGTMDEISPSGNPAQVIGRLAEDSTPDTCLLVSHQPFVSIFIKYLTDQEVYMDTANIICISLEVLGPNCGELEWFIHD